MTLGERLGALGAAVTVFAVLFGVRLTLYGLDAKGIWPVEDESLEILDWLIKMSAGSVLTVLGQWITISRVGNNQQGQFASSSCEDGR